MGEAGPTIERLELGLQGRYKSGRWTPLRIEIVAGQSPFAGSIEIVSRDGDGVDTRYRWLDAPAVALAPGESKQLSRLVKMGRRDGSLRIELVADNRVVSSREFSRGELSEPLESERELIVTYGPSGGAAELAERKSQGAQTPVVQELLNAARWPDSWLGWDAADVVVVTTSDLARMRAVSPVQVAALREWVERGGRLVLSLGRNAQELAGPSGPWAALVPGKLAAVAELRNLSPFETFTESTQRMDLGSAVNGLPFTVLSAVDGQVELADAQASGSRPIIVRSLPGFGELVFIAVDLDLPPLQGWNGRGKVMSRLLYGGMHQLPTRSTNSSGSAHGARFGYHDMVGQLWSGLDQFPGVSLVAFATVAVLVLVYILLIGPVDYFFLRDVVRKMTWTWVTFPVVTVAFIGLAWWLSPQGSASQVLLNQVDLVDIDGRTGAARGVTWAHLYSPRAAAYRISDRLHTDVSGAFSLQGNILAWHGLPGTGLGGLNTSAAAPPAMDEYRLEFGTSPDSSTRLENVPIHVAATKSLLGTWWGQFQPERASRLRIDADGLLTGVVKNPLPVTLEECVVYFDKWAYRLEAKGGQLRSGEEARMEVERALNLQWRLTGRRVIENAKDLSTPWDQHTLEVPKILEMMMFHSAAGGETYTQLVNRFQSYVDLSSHLTPEIAILFGRTRNAAVQMRVGDQDMPATQQWTYYRIIFPVQRWNSQSGGETVGSRD